MKSVILWSPLLTATTSACSIQVKLTLCQPLPKATNEVCRKFTYLTTMKRPKRPEEPHHWNFSQLKSSTLLWMSIKAKLGLNPTILASMKTSLPLIWPMIRFLSFHFLVKTQDSVLDSVIERFFSFFFHFLIRWGQPWPIWKMTILI